MNLYDSKMASIQKTAILKNNRKKVLTLEEGILQGKVKSCKNLITFTYNILSVTYFHSRL